ncbi:MAG: beta-hydroxyacyl-ACP dehydratase [Planctomycetales bacterium]|nr:beta-hydroxyacyl-ACP dehydratase [Planctomycetales bacterium]
MRFCHLDRICSYTPGAELTAIKNVSLAEEYLADHFPEFPVLPGVFMVEAATQAGAWLLRLTDGYAHSIITLAEARAVKFAGFVAPGHALRMTVTVTKREGPRTTLKFQGEVDGRACVSGRVTLDSANLADERPDMAALDARMIERQRELEAALLQRTGDAVPTP